MPNVTSKLSQTKVYAYMDVWYSYIAIKGSIKSSLLYCVYTVIVWFDHNRDIIKNYDVLMNNRNAKIHSIAQA